MKHSLFIDEDSSMAEVPEVAEILKALAPKNSWIIHSSSSSHTPELSKNLAYIQELRSSWRLDSNSCLSVPSLWFNSSIIDATVSSMNLAFLNAQLAPIRDQLIPNPATGLDSFEEEKNAMMVLNLMDYKPLPGFTDPSLVDRLANMFVGLESCWVKIGPRFRFPPPFSEIPDENVNFAVAHQVVQPTRDSMCIRARISPLSACSPALLIGIVDQSSAAPIDIHRLAKAAEPNLQALLMEHSFQPRARSDSEPLPPWAMIFGLYFHSESVSIVSHVHTSESFHSIPVDALSYPLRITSRADILSRLRLAVALLSLRQHVARLSSLFSYDSLWPHSIIDYEVTVIQEETGLRTPNPSEITVVGEGEINILISDTPNDDDIVDEEELKDREKVTREAVEQWLSEI